MESDSLPSGESLHLIFLNIAQYFNAWSSEYLYAIFLIIVLLLFSALISGSEVAFFSLSPAQKKELEEEDSVAANRVLKLLDSPRFLLATLLVANNFINVAIIVVSNFVITKWFNFEVFSPEKAVYFETLLNVGIVTPLLVLFGEVSPKVLATQENKSFAKFTVNLLRFCKTIFYPISWLLVKSGVFLESKLKRSKQEIDLDEIEKAIELGTKDHSSQEDIDILKGIVHFGNTTVKQIMKPRIDMVAIENVQTYDEVISVIRESGYSRIPIFNENIDQIIGTLYIKDLLGHLKEPSDFEWQKLVREPMFVPETKKIDDLLREIQADRKHQAIVVDEYGGTSGLVTLEDILEEVVGEIKDEFDDTLEIEHRKLDENNFLFEGKTLLNDVCRIIDVDNDTFDKAKGESDSLAGLIIEILGDFPKKGTKLEWGNFQFSIISLDKHRIEKVKLTKKEK